jgi:hypothetical protein
MRGGVGRTYQVKERSYSTKLIAHMRWAPSPGGGFKKSEANEPSAWLSSAVCLLGFTHNQTAQCTEFHSPRPPRASLSACSITMSPQRRAGPPNSVTHPRRRARRLVRPEQVPQPRRGGHAPRRKALPASSKLSASTHQSSTRVTSIVA